MENVLIRIRLGNDVTVQSALFDGLEYLDPADSDVSLLSRFNVTVDDVEEVQIPEGSIYRTWDQAINELTGVEVLLVFDDPLSLDNGYMESAQIFHSEDGNDPYYVLFDGESLIYEPVGYYVIHPLMLPNVEIANRGIDTHTQVICEWVVANDSRPNDRERVLAYFPTQSTSPMDALYVNGQFIVDGIDRTEAVTHWMRMPKGPFDD